MLNETDAHRFATAKERMRTLVGERVYSSWFCGLKAEALAKRKHTGKSLLLSVATVGPRHSIKTYYMDAVRTACMEVWPDLEHIELVVRTLGKETSWSSEAPSYGYQGEQPEPSFSDELDERLRAYAPFAR